MRGSVGWAVSAWSPRTPPHPSLPCRSYVWCRARRAAVVVVVVVVVAAAAQRPCVHLRARTRPAPGLWRGPASQFWIHPLSSLAPLSIPTPPHPIPTPLSLSPPQCAPAVCACACARACACACVCPSMCRFVCVSVCVAGRARVSVSAFASASVSASVSVCLPVCPFNRVSVCVSGRACVLVLLVSVCGGAGGVAAVRLDSHPRGTSTPYLPTSLPPRPLTCPLPSPPRHLFPRPPPYPPPFFAVYPRPSLTRRLSGVRWWRCCSTASASPGYPSPPRPATHPPAHFDIIIIIITINHHCRHHCRYCYRNRLHHPTMISIIVIKKHALYRFNRYCFHRETFFWSAFCNWVLDGLWLHGLWLHGLWLHGPWLKGGGMVGGAGAAGGRDLRCANLCF